MSRDESNALTDQQFHDLLKQIDKSLDPNKRSSAKSKLGARLARSLEYYAGNTDEKIRWSPPPSDIILPVDLEILSLMGRDRRPRLDRVRAKNDPALQSGPFILARVEMTWFANVVGDPLVEADHSVRTSNRIDLIDDLISQLKLLTSIHYGHFIPRLSQRALADSLEGRIYSWSQADELIMRALHHCNDSVGRLTQMRGLLKDELDLDKRNQRGSPRHITKASFVAMVADLWLRLTGEPSSRNEDRLFGDFVYAVWNSYDDEMPEVSFARAIRDRP